VSGRIDGPDRDVYRRLVEVILPAAAGMPSGNAVGVADDGLDRVLEVRPDIVGDMLRALRIARDASAADVVESLQKTDAEGWAALRTAAFGAYYTSSSVQAAIGYTGQLASPFDPDVEPAYLIDGKIDAVLARGPIWRHSPT
jgi:hypothetical protein